MCVRTWVIFIVSLPIAASSQVFTTNFDGSENPLSEGGAWVSKPDSDMTHIRKVSGVAQGTQTAGGYNDSGALLNGWATTTDQTAIGVLYVVTEVPSSQYIELWLRGTTTNGHTNVYECEFQVESGGGAGSRIYRLDDWPNFHLIGSTLGVTCAVHNGDTLKATAIGDTIRTYINGVLKAQAIDGTYATGASGIGTYIQNDGANSNFGWTSFTAIALVAPAAPTLVSPPDGATGELMTPRVIWNRLASAMAYHLQAANDSSFTLIVFDDSTLADTSRVVTGLLNNTSYYWRVKARNLAGWSPWSERWIFTTLLTGFDEQMRLPSLFRLNQNYPNPFNPSTVISFDLHQLSHVSLEIFNMMGRKIRSLVNGLQEAGSFALPWDGRDDATQRVSSGIYMYRLSAGGKTMSRKMLLLK